MGAMNKIWDNKENCCGCGACAQCCPQQCIIMKEDEEGFLYPEIDKDKCIDCGLCVQVCPFIHQYEERIPIKSFAAKHPNDEIRLKSSSGGVFHALVKVIIDRKGVVFGAAFNERWDVAHTYFETLQECEKFMGSKYSQSIIGDSFLQVERFLQDGRWVLFSGTPCQIAGLKSYLGKEYDTLLTVDLLCHGVPSPGMYRWYIKERLEKVAQEGDKNSVSSSSIRSIPQRNALDADGGVRIESITFRNKRKGWKKFGFALTLAKATADGKSNTVSLSYTLEEDPFLKGFLNDLYLRPSCHHCKARNFKSGSDITLGDFWGIGKVLKEYDDDKGVSAVMINTTKGEDFFESINLETNVVDFQAIRKYNPVIWKSPRVPAKREMMFNGNDGFIARVNRLTKPSVIRRLKRIARIILRRG